MQEKRPKGWILKPFTSILDIQGGTQPPKEIFISEEKDGYIRLLQIRDFGEKPVPTYIPNESNLKKCSKDDILIARYGASIGRIVTGQEGAYNVALAKVIIPKPINPRFVLWLLKSPLFQTKITAFQRTAQNGFNKDDLSGLEVPLPPLPEQQRIVAKLDSLFGQLDRMKTSMERIPQLLKDFRQKVLTQAVTGKLTEEWRDGRELEEWKTVPIDKLVLSVRKDIRTGPFGSSLNKTEHQNKGVPVWGIESISKNGDFTWSNKIFITEEKAEELKSFEVIGGDIIISRSGTVGELCLLPIEVPFGIISTNLMKISLNKEVINPNYFCYQFKGSQILIEKLEELCSGSTRLFLTQSILKQLDFTLPSLEEQQEIIRRVESLFAKADQIEASYQKLKEKIEQLPQSLLAKAFRGELVEQLPTDGDARDLLEQIKKAKAGLEKGGKTKKLGKEEPVRMVAEDWVRYGKK